MDTAQVQDEALVEKASGTDHSDSIISHPSTPNSLRIRRPYCAVLIARLRKVCLHFLRKGTHIAVYFFLFSDGQAPIITKEEGRLWPHNETAMQMRDKVQLGIPRLSNTMISLVFFCKKYVGNAAS